MTLRLERRSSPHLPEDTGSGRGKQADVMHSNEVEARDRRARHGARLKRADPAAKLVFVPNGHTEFVCFVQLRAGISAGHDIVSLL
jgi:hypothetical protein